MFPTFNFIEYKLNSTSCVPLFLYYTCLVLFIVIPYHSIRHRSVEVTVHTFLGLAQDEAATPHEKEPTVLTTQDTGCVPENNAMKTQHNVIKCESKQTKCHFMNEKILSSSI